METRPLYFEGYGTMLSTNNDRSAIRGVGEERELIGWHFDGSALSKAIPVEELWEAMVRVWPEFVTTA